MREDTEKTNVEKALERLEEMLAERDATIPDLEAKIAGQELEKNWRWCLHVDYKIDPSPNLPIPRLEIRINPKISGDLADAGTWQAGQILTYALVYKHLLGHVVFVPLGYTDRGGGLGRKPEMSPEALWHELPFRDGAHIQNEMAQLNLPGFRICGSIAVAIPPRDQ